MPFFFDSGAPSDSVVESDRILTVPNALSLIRLAALPFVYLDLVNGNEGRALIVLMVIVWSDYLDGYLARKLNQVSRVGRLFDPISDRILMVVVGIAMIVAGILPLWAVLVIVGRDVVILVGGLVLMRRGIEPPQVSDIGKAATFGLMTALPLFILARAVDVQNLRGSAWVVFGAGCFLYYLSAGQYIQASVQQLRARTGGP